jgi:Tfp pilus assembly PilM family ATPase
MSIRKWISQHIPTPQYMSMMHVGIDISATSIHILEIKRKGSHLELGRYGVQVQRKYKLDFVEVSIPEDHAYIFTMDVPYGSDESVRNHIELHLEENVPITLADAVFDYLVIERPFADSSEAVVEQQENKNDKEELVTVSTASKNSDANSTFFASISVVQKSLIDQYIELFESAFMTPVSFLIENQALSKSIIKKGVLDTKLIVHVGDMKSVLSVVSKGSVHFTSTVNIGSEDFTAAIMKELGVTREEALRLKTERGRADGPNQSTIFMSLINTASALKDEIDKIILYWQSYVGKRGHSNENSIEGLIISGHDALINGFREYLAATIKLPVDTANVWANVYDLDKKIPDIDYIDSLDYAATIGLALPRLED